MTSEAPQNPYCVRLYCEEIDVTLTSITVPLYLNPVKKITYIKRLTVDVYSMWNN